MKLTAVYLKVLEGYIGFDEELPGGQHNRKYAQGDQGKFERGNEARVGSQSNDLRRVASRPGCNSRAANKTLAGGGVLRAALPWSAAGDGGLSSFVRKFSRIQTLELGGVMYRNSAIVFAVTLLLT